VPRCSYHPNVETELRCTECGRYICPKEMVETPVGYKCPDDARQPRSAVRTLHGKQWFGALGFGALAAVGGALVFTLFLGGFFGWFLGFIWGGLTAEAVHRGSGGHRGGAVTAISIGAIVFGTLLSWLVIGPVVGRPGVSIIVAIIAAFGAAGDSAAWWARR
jgi:hypothetical protein